MKKIFYTLILLLVVNYTATAQTAPSAPEASSSDNITSFGFNANWDSSATATLYYLEVATNHEFTHLVIGYNNLCVSKEHTSNYINGLDEGSAYFFRIRAYNENGISEYSNTISVVTLLAIEAQPADTNNICNIDFGRSIKITVSRPDATSFQWYKSGIILNDNGNYTGTKTAAFEINSLTTQDSGFYYCVASTISGNLMSDALILNVQSHLPVELLSFVATSVNKSVSINWATASELNNDYYTIERSEDGFTYNTIITIKGAGNSNMVLNYQYSDYDANENSVLYYRLRQTDYDGNFEYVATAWVNNTVNSAPSDPAITYSETDHSIKIAVNCNDAQNVAVSIYNMNGCLLTAREIATESGQNMFTLNNCGAKGGTYIITLISNDQAFSKKISLF